MDKNNFPEELDIKWFDTANDKNPSKEIRAEFIKALESVKNSWELADWRYELGLDSNDPNNSHWMTRYINRELTKRKEEGNEARIRSRFWISTIIAIFSVIIAFTSFVVSYNKEKNPEHSSKAVKTENSLNKTIQPTANAPAD